MMGLTRYEQETIVNYNQEEKTAIVYTHDPALQRRLDRLIGVRPDISLECGQHEWLGAKTYIVPKSWVKVSPPRTVNMTDERREEMARRMSELRQAQLSSVGSVSELSPLSQATN